MANEEKVTFYMCRVCKKVVEVVKDSFGTMTCCSAQMEKLIPNTTDASSEKHVPVVTIDNGKINVKVGSIPHPMIDEHYIEWIVATYGNRVNRYILKPGDEPAAAFCAKNPDMSDLEVYAYCNLHGLWKA